MNQEMNGVEAEKRQENGHEKVDYDVQEKIDYVFNLLAQLLFSCDCVMLLTVIVQSSYYDIIISYIGQLVTQKSSLNS